MNGEPRIEIGLNAAIVAVFDGAPNILRIHSADNTMLDALPYGRFDPLAHRPMEEGLRSLAEDQTGLRPGYVEQLYTFGDRGRAPGLHQFRLGPRTRHKRDGCSAREPPG